MSRKIARLGDPSSHGGTIITSSASKTLVEGIPPSLDGDLHSCPIEDHGVTPIKAITTKTYVEGKLVLSDGAIAGCGAIIIGTAKKSFVE